MIPLDDETWLAVLPELGGWPVEHAVSVRLHRKFWEHHTPMFVNIKLRESQIFFIGNK